MSNGRERFSSVALVTDGRGKDSLELAVSSAPSTLLKQISNNGFKKNCGFVVCSYCNYDRVQSEVLRTYYLLMTVRGHKEIWISR
jgi:hypothetical protein